MRVRHILAAIVLASAATNAYAQPPVACRFIKADHTWQETGIEIVAGQRVCVQADGNWSHGPEPGGITPFHGPRGYIGKPDIKPPPIVPWPYARIGTLLGKIDDGSAFPIEDELCFIAATSGELLLSMNDVPGSFKDNEGFMRVRITIAPDHGGGGGISDLSFSMRHNARCSR